MAISASAAERNRGQSGSTLPYSPLHFGALSGALRKQRDGVPGRAVLHAPERGEPHRAAIEQYEQLCAGLGQEPTTVAIAWLLSRPEVTAPILGPRTAPEAWAW